jgi:hypothetical protein
MRDASANMFDLIAVHARRPGQLAMEAPDATSLTYGALFERSARAANALVTLGVEPGARVAAGREIDGRDRACACVSARGRGVATAQYRVHARRA